MIPFAEVILLVGQSVVYGFVCAVLFLVGQLVVATIRNRWGK